jgi:peptidoglycan/LPS O-acetylase OafA/YrhL
MHNKGWLTKILALAGTFLAWLPVVAMVFITAAMLIRHQGFHFDYLIPAELFPVFLGGGLLLLWGSIRAKCYRRWIGAGLGAAVVFLVAGQSAAVATGLASGATRPGGWQSTVVLGAIILYDLAVIAVGVGGILLILRIFKSETNTAPRVED